MLRNGPSRRCLFYGGLIALSVSAPASQLLAGNDDAGVWAAMKFSAPAFQRQPAKPAPGFFDRPPLAYAPAPSGVRPFLGLGDGQPLRPLRRASRPAEPPTIPNASPDTLRQRLVCVRLCDGDQLVLGFKGAAASDEEYASMCDAAGGTEQTALFSSELGNGEVQLEHFRGRDAGTAYASIDDFLSEEHRHGKAGQCPVQIAEKPLSVPLEADATLRKGDVVATAKGFVVFVGDEGLKHQERSFVTLDRARGISTAVRRALGTLASR